MKSNHQQKANPEKIQVNHIVDNLLQYDMEFYYFEKLNVFVLQYAVFYDIGSNGKKNLVRALEKGEDNQLHFQENRLTRQIQRKIQQERKQDRKQAIYILEETEEIIFSDSNCLKICTFQQQQNEFQMGMRNFQNNKVLLGIGAFEKYYLGYDQNQVYLFRKKNMKIILRQIVNDTYAQIQDFHLLCIIRNKDALFYKRSSFKLKIIRKYNTQISEYIYLLGRYFAVVKDKLIIIDSTNMKEQQYSNILIKSNYGVDPIQQLGIFLITNESQIHIKNLKSIKLQQNTIVQTMILNYQCQFLKYCKRLGLLLFYVQD